MGINCFVELTLIKKVRLMKLCVISVSMCLRQSSQTF